MTTPNHPTGQPSTAWQRHHATTEAAMHDYLTTTHAAHRQYLTGPWPDRDAYNAVEVSAWMTYHAKCRAAWQDYRAETTTPPPPPASNQPIPIPVYPSDHRTDHEAHAAWEPTSTDYRPGGYLPDADSANPAFPEFHPKNERH